ncbi:hypothetical protein RHMOL_Rhmol08G0015400 [Rhododendron molle]|uniref:Uncharacterized protein n=1 Tax=Rhododendron molle TaxID=49168 RepID=A0ACC0MIM4_RHOML|nr:hypothetical protein RHMOL_Rhmol08G0015400 [Rhododendron molle]
MERYEILRDIGSGNFGVAKLVRDKWSNDHYAVKFIERGDKIDEHVQREIMNHRSLNHPNIIRFKEVLLTPTHLGIVMEYAAGGELFERICNAGRFSEDEARFFFQQLISGVKYCHSMQICHRDLKLENTLLHGSSAPRLKICDFGYSKSSVLHSQPKSTVGTPAYIAPEVFSRKEYDGKRITIPEIEKHSWFQKNLPIELTEEGEASLQMSNDINPSQSTEEVLAIIQEASKSAALTKGGGDSFIGGSMDFDDIIDDDTDPDDIERSGDFVYAL